ncbi:MAG: cytochrome C [Geobacteraceae bacterium]|nr:cytochrome C [Geobacteraceae bacterium]
MKKQLSTICLFIVLMAVSNALAVGPGKILEFPEESMGLVIFDGTTHKAAGFSCGDCHNPDVFPAKKKGSVKMTMKDLYEGKFCGKCHDGKNGFLIKENCDRCHFKPGA